jgi:PST family polysaccharide transporter
VAPEFIRVIYGEKWIPAALPLQLLCLSGWSRALGNPAGAILEGTGRPGVNFALNLTLAALLTAGVCAAAPFGVPAVAGAVTVAYCLIFPFVQWVVLRCIGMRGRDYLRALVPAVTASALMSAAVWALRGALPAALPEAARLGMLVAVGILVYFGSLALLHRDVLVEGLDLLLHRRAEEGTPS